jgi:hypothetical protein
MNPLYPPVLGDFIIFGGHPIRQAQGRPQCPRQDPPKADCTSEKDMGTEAPGFPRILSLIESGTGSAGMTYEARAQCTVPLHLEILPLHYVQGQNDI